jgi:hypothetical protein
LCRPKGIATTGKMRFPDDKRIRHEDGIVATETGQLNDWRRQPVHHRRSV